MTIRVTWKRTGSISPEAKRGWRKNSRNVKIAMLVPTSVTTRLTSRLAVSFPTVGPPSPLHQDACSIIQNGYECFHFQAGLASIRDEVSETTSVAMTEPIRRVL